MCHIPSKQFYLAFLVQFSLKPNVQILLLSTFYRQENSDLEISGTWPKAVHTAGKDGSQSVSCCHSTVLPGGLHNHLPIIPETQNPY